MTALDAVCEAPGGRAILDELAAAHRRWDDRTVAACRCQLAALLADQPDPAAVVAEVEACVCGD